MHRVPQELKVFGSFFLKKELLTFTLRKSGSMPIGIKRDAIGKSARGLCHHALSVGVSLGSRSRALPDGQVAVGDSIASLSIASLGLALLAEAKAHLELDALQLSTAFVQTPPARDSDLHQRGMTIKNGRGMSYHTLPDHLE